MNTDHLADVNTRLNGRVTTHDPYDPHHHLVDITDEIHHYHAARRRDHRWQPAGRLAPGHYRYIGRGSDITITRVDHGHDPGWYATGSHHRPLVDVRICDLDADPFAEIERRITSNTTTS